VFFRKTDIGHATTQGFTWIFKPDATQLLQRSRPRRLACLLSTSKKNAPYYIMQVASTC